MPPAPMKPSQKPAPVKPTAPAAKAPQQPAKPAGAPSKPGQPAKPPAPAAKPAAPAPAKAPTPPAKPATKPAPTPAAPAKHPAATKPAQPQAPVKPGNPATQPTTKSDASRLEALSTALLPANLKNTIITMFKDEAFAGAIAAALAPYFAGAAADEEVDLFSELRNAEGELDGSAVYENVSKLTMDQLNSLPTQIDGFTFPPNVKGLIPMRNFFKKWMDENLMSDTEEEATEEAAEGEYPQYQNEETGEWTTAVPVDQLTSGDYIYLTKDLGDNTYHWLPGMVFADDDGNTIFADTTGDRYIVVKVSVTKENMEIIKAIQPPAEKAKVKIGAEAAVFYYPDLPVENQEFDYAGRVDAQEEQAAS